MIHEYPARAHSPLRGSRDPSPRYELDPETALPPAGRVLVRDGKPTGPEGRKLLERFEGRKI